jgi:hypothetical protein
MVSLALRNKNWGGLHMSSKEPKPASPTRRYPKQLWSGIRRFLIVAVSTVPLTPVRIARGQKGDVAPGGVSENTLDYQQDAMQG